MAEVTVSCCRELFVNRIIQWCNLNDTWLSQNVSILAYCNVTELATCDAVLLDLFCRETVQSQLCRHVNLVMLEVYELSGCFLI